MRYNLPAADIYVGHKIDLPEHGLDNPVMVLKAYRGRLVANDTRLGEYDLSKLHPDDEARNRGEAENPEANEGMTLIVAPKSGDRGTVIYIADHQVEMSVIADNEGGDF